MLDKNKCEIIINIAKTLIKQSDLQLLSDDNLQEVLNKAYDSFKVNYSNEEKKYIERELYSCYKVKASDGVMIIDDYEHQQWYEKNQEEFHWGKYKEIILQGNNFPEKVINKLENDTLYNIMNQLGNPKCEEHFTRKGLVIGDVQSGKTATYTGLICKAADAGYKVVILLTGTIESLRKQTQKRIEEGFVGVDSSKFEEGSKDFRVGVGKGLKDIRVNAFTSYDTDFTGNKNKIISSINSNNIVLFVIKKNVSVLKKLINWLRKLNADHQGMIDHPMLLIDDEADNASINTSKDGDDPTKTNKLIRNLTELFTKSNYVGFTATPYANVFIKPEKDEDMENEDLFPKDFIYVLPTPENYIGPMKVFSPKGKYYSSLNFIDDTGEVKTDGYPFYYKHKKYWEGDLPKSLIDSLYTYLIANTIRDLRGDICTHRTMMINISRFTNVQFYIEKTIKTEFEKIKNSIKFNLYKSSVLTDENLKRLYKIFISQYSNNEYSWEDICGQIFNSIKDIEFRVVNSKNKLKLNYDDYKKGLRVIAIGGIALSRGLTLEGLLISYFYRNTSTYDVLMQMGRFFGYRKGYDDLFRIWTGAESAKWYYEIADATEELKHDIKEMFKQKKTPKEFGLRVRQDSDKLKITANNKMRFAESFSDIICAFGNFYQTPYLHNKVDINKDNLKHVKELVNTAIKENNSIEKLRNSVLINNLSRNYIIKFLHKIHIHNKNFKTAFDVRQILNNICNVPSSKIQKWDVVLVSGSGKDIELNNSIKIKSVNRAFSLENDNEEYIHIGKKGMLSGPGDATLGNVNIDDIINADLKHKEVTNKLGKSAKAYFKYIPNRNPLLLIYLIKLKNSKENNYNKVIIEEENKIINKFKNNYLVGFGLGLPSIGNNETIKERIKYKANRTYMQDPAKWKLEMDENYDA